MAKQIFRKNCIGFRTSFFSWRKNSTSRRRRDSEFVWKNGGKSVGRASRVPRLGVFCIFLYKTGVSLRLHSNLFYQKFVMNESPATASLHSATPKRKNVPCSFDFRGGGFFLKWKGHFSFWGSAFQVFRQCGGASIRTRFCQKYFLGKRIWQNLDWIFPPAERGLGNECGRVCISFLAGWRKILKAVLPKKQYLIWDLLNFFRLLLFCR